MASQVLYISKNRTMPIYQKHGKIPSKRHVVFRNGEGLYHEELFGTEGFSSTSSLVYHLNPPTMVQELGDPFSVRPEIAIEDNLRALSFTSFETMICRLLLPSQSKAWKSISSRMPIAMN
jgi:hypothetical protein